MEGVCSSPATSGNRAKENNEDIATPKHPERTHYNANNEWF